ncbi:MAG: radical SAM protein [Ignavibacteriaceae bacterium]|nr:radical SAM protein [Ignavibacteriaceae bacterium]
MKENVLKVNEIYFSIQGEGTAAGLPCVFIRLTWCNLRCTYCDSEYSFYEGKNMTFDEILEEVKKYNCELVELTGGEPLVQSKSIDFMKTLCDLGYKVLIETGGSLPVKNIDPRVTVIMDLKCPSSGMAHKNRLENLQYLKKNDELKFVIGSLEDYEWCKKIIEKHNLTGKCEILFSTVFGKLAPVDLVNKILEDNLKVRFQLQMHKFIWAPDLRGV